MTVYDFERQRANGVAGEAVLREYFAECGAPTRPANADEQRRGIDFWLVLPGGEESFEVKTDTTAGRSHNAFIETQSVDVADKPGWAYTCQADWLVYYIPVDGLAYVLRPPRLRRELRRWKETYPLRAAQNDGYRTWGLVIPLWELERIKEAALCP